MDEYSMSSYQWLAEQLDTPILGPERAQGNHRVRAEWIKAGACDIVRVAVGHERGLTPATKTVHLAESFGWLANRMGRPTSAWASAARRRQRSTWMSAPTRRGMDAAALAQVGHHPDGRGRVCADATGAGHRAADRLRLHRRPRCRPARDAAPPAREVGWSNRRRSGNRSARQTRGDPVNGIGSVPETHGGQPDETGRDHLRGYGSA